MASGDFLVLSAPAKVNLNLIIKGRRADGYHELETLMTRISLADELHITLNNSGEITLECDADDIPSDESNLAVRAARLFFLHTGTRIGCHIRLVKRIPAGAGLGGGSSNAAAVLRALNELTNNPLHFQSLLSVAAQIGSDVPFFLHDCQSAVCTGRGEMVNPLPRREDFPKRCFLIYPGFAVSTAWAYKAYDAWATVKPALEAPWAKFSRTFTWGSVYNDLQAVVFQKFLWLPVVWEWLMQRNEVQAAVMSGSGSSLFALLYPSVSEPELVKSFREEFGDTVFAICCDLGVVPSSAARK